MTLDELIHALEKVKENHYRDGGILNVVIPLSIPSMGPVASANIISIRAGIDWDKNNVFLYPEKKVIPMPDRESTAKGRAQEAIRQLDKLFLLTEKEKDSLSKRMSRRFKD